MKSIYKRRYICTVEHGGGFGGGYGGAYTDELEYESKHRANSKGNYMDARIEFRRKYGRAGWVEVVPNSAFLVRD